MRFELKVALRFLREGRGQTLFILLGIAIGVAVQVFLGTLIGGLQDDLIQATVGRSSHITIQGEDAGPGSPLPGVVLRPGVLEGKDTSLDNWEALVEVLDRNPDLTVVSPVIAGSGALRSGTLVMPVVLRGIDPGRANGLYGLETSLVSGSYLLDGSGILLGTGVAEELQLSVGDSVRLELPGNRSGDFLLQGIFDLGSAALNDSWAFLELDRAAGLLETGSRISAVETQVADVFAADVVAAGIGREISGVSVENWKDANRDLLTALNSQSSSSLTIQVFVLLAITLGIASVLAVSVVQKSRQIGILKAMGTPAKVASRIFLLQGGILGLLGSLIGILMGWGLTQAFLWGTSLGTGQPLFPLQFRAREAVVIVVIATTASILSAVFPARRSARLSPIDVIRG